MKKIEKQSNPKMIDLFWWKKQHENVSVLINLHQNF